MEDEKLIKSVKRYQFLYDLSHPYYTDGDSKDRAWKEISENLKQPASACKNRWQKLRDSYRRALNKRRFKGVPSRKLKKWTYENEMSFLQQHFVLRTGDLTNDEFVMSDGTQSSQPIDFGTPIEGDCKPQVTWEMDRMKNSDEGTRNESITENVPYDVTQNAAWNDLSHYSNINAEDGVSDASSTIIETKKQKMLNTKKSEAQLLNSTALIAELLKSNDDSQTRDEIDNFFLNMASTVRKLTPYSQAITKNKIFSLISRCELEHLASLT